MTELKTTGYTWDEIKTQMEQQEWEDNRDGDGQVRFVYLGSLINPSGKYYLPFACSNLDACGQCGGRGKIRKARPRLLKKLHGVSKWLQIKVDGWKFFWSLPHTERQKLLRSSSSGRYEEQARKRLLTLEPSCGRCGGCGSSEAHDDEVFWELLEAEASEHGYGIESGEGDPCVTFVAEYRDMPEEEEEEEEDPCLGCDELPPGEFCSEHHPEMVGQPLPF